MATFKVMVQQHQQRRDGKFPISIRVTHNRKSCYIPTGFYCSLSQINKKSFEVKDPFIITRVAKIISDWERKMLTVDEAYSASMDIKELKNFLTLSSGSIDYLQKARELIKSNYLKWGNLESALRVFEEMGITQMSANDFNSLFLRKFKEFLDNKLIPVTKNGIIVGYKHYAQNTKRNYLFKVCQVFRILQREYNTEFNTVISHNPFFGLEQYRTGLTAKRSMTAEQVRAFFELDVKSSAQRMVVDLMKLSFCLCGLNLMDIFFMEKSSFDEENMRITYIRHKTKDRRIGQIPTSVHIEPEIYDIIKKYRAPSSSKYLLYFWRYKPDYASTKSVCCTLSNMCKIYNFQHISPYWFRHTWATIARNDCDISKDDIDLCLAHAGNNPMADVYIKPDWSRIDRANRKVLDYVFGTAEKQLQM